MKPSARTSTAALAIGAGGGTPVVELPGYLENVPLRQPMGYFVLPTLFWCVFSVTGRVTDDQFGIFETTIMDLVRQAARNCQRVSCVEQKYFRACTNFRSPLN
jgi:hypothetical protein